VNHSAYASVEDLVLIFLAYLRCVFVIL